MIATAVSPPTRPIAGSALHVPDDRARERELVLSAQRGSREAFAELVRAYQRRAYAVARAIVLDHHDAEDAVQDGFLHAYRALARFRPGEPFGAWLHRIVANAALMKLRTRGRRPEESIEELLPNFLDDGHHVEQFSEWSLPADARMLRHETRTLVRAAIDRLPDSYRTVLLLRDIEELTTEETAQALGVTSNTVKIRLHRARQALLKLLTPSMARSHTASREAN
jgi:RNA polymerase sigma-70 factor (ECF subfamily)